LKNQSQIQQEEPIHSLKVNGSSTNKGPVLMKAAKNINGTESVVLDLNETFKREVVR
jgi:hypothetical protein